MSKKKLVQKYGAECNNWYYSWSYINTKEKFIIFGLWAHVSGGYTGEIFSEDWEYNSGKKNKGYKQSREHIRLIENKKYTLKIFLMHAHPETIDNDDITISIKSLENTLYDRSLVKVGRSWHAVISNHNYTITEEIDPNDPSLHEGAKKQITVNAYERSNEARKKCIEHYGYKCQICNFDFQVKFGDLGTDYIHVHHIKPLHTIEGTYVVDPIKDLIPLCPNCHAMIHRRRPELSISELKKILKSNKV